MPSFNLLNITYLTVIFTRITYFEEYIQNLAALAGKRMCYCYN